ncbi:MAG: glycosyltransferase family 4 protein [Candidatus Methanodesulfokora washburnensis]
MAIALKRIGIDVVVLYDGREQYTCLSEELENWNIRHYINSGLHRVDLIGLTNGIKLLRDIIKKEKNFDFILGGGVREGIKVWASTKRFGGKPIGISVIGSIPNKKIEQFIAIASYNTFYNKCIVLSKHSEGQLIKLGLKSDKIWVIPLFAPDLEWFDRAKQLKVDLEAYNLQDIKHPVVFYAAGHYPHKGFEYYLMAASKVLKKLDATFVLGGRGPLTCSLKETAKKLGIYKNVIFTGWISNYHMPYIQSNVADICVSSSLKETLSSYLLECMAAGKPVIATNTGVAPEVVKDYKNGFVIMPGDAEKMAKKIIWLIEHYNEARNMGINARKTIEEKINMKLAINDMIDHLETLHKMS